jgi:transcriptional regulator with XRE-family HTH domain
MISINFITPHDMKKEIAYRFRNRRLELNLSQQTLSKKSGISYSSLKKFEQTGQISLESLLKLAIILSFIDDFMELFAPKSTNTILSLDELIKDETRIRKRGRQ